MRHKLVFKMQVINHRYSYKDCKHSNNCEYHRKSYCWKEIFFRGFSFSPDVRQDWRNACNQTNAESQNYTNNSISNAYCGQSIGRMFCRNQNIACPNKDEPQVSHNYRQSNI